MAAIDSLEKALKYHFGYDQFRPNQRQIIEAALNNQDLLVIMPTGGGKSLCFQLPALIKKGVTVVVSPLIALMQDQVTALADNGIGATFLNSTLNAKQVRERESLILQGKIKLLYVAPERLLSPSFLDFLAVIDNYLGLACLAVDEAHCVSDWGHDFRPEYRQIKQVRQRFPSVPILALTATATQQVREDIIQQLGLRDTSIHIASFNRPNLYYEVQPKTSKSYQQLYQYIKGGLVLFIVSAAKPSIKLPNSYKKMVLMPYPIMRVWRIGKEAKIKPVLFGMMCRLWWRQLPSVWGLINRMCALSFITIYPAI